MEEKLVTMCVGLERWLRLKTLAVLNPGSIPSSQLSATLVPEDLVPSFCLCGDQARISYIDIHGGGGSLYTYKKKRKTYVLKLIIVYVNLKCF